VFLLGLVQFLELLDVILLGNGGIGAKGCVGHFLHVFELIGQHEIFFLGRDKLLAYEHTLVFGRCFQTNVLFDLLPEGFWHFLLDLPEEGVKFIHGT